MPRGVDLVVALLAVLKSGRPYVPLDPALGRARAEAVVAEAAAPILLVPAPGAPGTPDVPGGTIVVGVREHAPADAVIPAVPRVGPDAPCYVIYTSGSTGRPKGVVVPHRAVVNVCQWHHRRFACTPADRSALLCSPSFDASVLETWPALTAGACVVVADDDARRDAKALARWYTEQRITFTMLPTALAETLLELAPADQPPLLRHCAAGGDVLRTRPRPGTGYEVVNIYGPTEVTVLCTHQGVPPSAPGDAPAPIPIGRPIDNVRLTVLDEHGSPVPIGVPGELHVAGPGLADGYLHQPGATAERFVTGAGPGSGGERYYRTGDLVRWTEQGVLEFLGRGDDQVKIRGFRVEPEEVSRALSALPEVREALVLPRRGSRQEARLVAFVVPAHRAGDADTDRQEFADRLTRQLAQRLPEYLVPRSWAVLPRLPLTGTGKVDRSALPEPRHTTHLADPAHRAAAVPASVTPVTSDPDRPASAAPGTDGTVLERLRALWATELDTDPGSIGPETSFFALGGHSITAIRLANRIRAEFDADLPMTRFYQEPTLGAVVRFLGGDDTGDAAARIVHRAPLTLQQQGFVTGHHEHPLPEVYNVAMRITLTGRLDVDALRRALTALLARHESLRLRFAQWDGQWQQEVLPARPVDLPEEDLTALPTARRDAEIDRIGTDAARTPFDLAAGAGPALRLLRTGPSRWVLLFVLHHGLCDGWAVSVVLHDLAALYDEALTGVPHTLPPAAQTTDFARWQRTGTRRPQEEARRADYWVRRLSGVPFRLDLPTDRPRPAQPSGEGSVVLFTVPPDVRADVERLARRRGCTAFAVTAAALGLLLADVTGQQDVLFTVPYANRERQEFESLVACTAGLYVLRVPVGAARDFGELVDVVAHAGTEGADHVLSLVKVVAALRKASGDDGIPNRLPVGFAYQNSLRTDLTLRDLDVAVEDLFVPAVTKDASFGLVPAGEVMTGYIAYSTDLWEEKTVRGWADTYVALLTDRVREALAE